MGAVDLARPVGAGHLEVHAAGDLPVLITHVGRARRQPGGVRIRNQVQRPGGVGRGGADAAAGLVELRIVPEGGAARERPLARVEQLSQLGGDLVAEGRVEGRGRRIVDRLVIGDQGAPAVDRRGRQQVGEGLVRSEVADGEDADVVVELVVGVAEEGPAVQR